MQRFVKIGVLTVLAAYILVFVVLGPNWAQPGAEQTGAAISQKVHETDWKQAGSDFADRLFGQPSRR